MLLFSFLCSLVACNNSSGDRDAVSDSSDNTGVHASADPVVGFAEGSPFVLKGCYEMTMKRDTATLNLQVQDTVVTGDLVYRWYERDGNTGTIKGVLRDSLIVADYTFESEGMTSVREVIFRIKDTTLVQAFGELDARQDKVVFRNPSQVQYMVDNPFVKVDCD